MGLVSIPLAMFLWTDTMPPVPVYLWSLLGTSGFYLLAQFFLFSAITHSEPSRVAPMLGLKVFILALISVIFLNQQFNISKWIAVAFTTTAVLLLSGSGKRLEVRFILFGLLACISYSMSDLCIKKLVDHFACLGVLPGAVMATALSYALCGVFGVVAVALNPKHSTRDTWLYALPFAASWFLGVLFLYACFGLTNVVFGTIMQSLRGILSIVLGFVIAHIGFEALEPKPSRRTVIQRLIAAVLMTTAVVLFLI
jgi:drug/metabolite transporter (DMT)-like permease